MLPFSSRFDLMVFVPSKNLRTCADCGHQVSRNADACPQCGASFKRRHGIFFYVFWGVISLFATIFILWILLMVFLGVGFVAVPAFVAARHESQARTESQTSNSAEVAASPANDLSKQKMYYINDNLVLYDFTSKVYDSVLDGKVPGVDFKIKNTGDKTLKKIEVTVYFKDSSDNVIYDEKFYPVLVTQFGTDNESLNPGYIWQQEQGKFYAAKKVPSEWQEGNAVAKITDIEFGDIPGWLIKQQKEQADAAQAAANSATEAQAAANAAIEAQKKKTFELEKHTVEWLLSQATNGSASAQCSLGIHYLNGQGCEINREQAIFWLQKAAEQGDFEASNKLASLKK